jgi:hypothetical protein
MNIDVRGFDSDRKRTPEELEIDQIVCQYNINTLKSRRRVINREKAKEKVLIGAITVAMFTILALIAAHRFKEDDQYFSEHAFTEKDAPYNVNIADKDIADAEQYYDELTNQNRKQR